MTDENVAVMVPNSQFISERVTNWSRPGKLTGYSLSFHVSHSSDPELVHRILLAAASSHTDVLGEPPPQVEFVEAGLAALRFQLLVWSTAHLKTAGTLKSDLNFEVWRQLAVARNRGSFVPTGGDAGATNRAAKSLTPLAFTICGPDVVAGSAR